MPYTPPSHRSPASSTSVSPDVSRRSSLQSGSTRPSLPRSASYLLKHRRTPSFSAVSDGGAAPLTPQGTSEDLQAMVVTSPSVRQSPPPRTDDRGMPSGAIISPPESASSGSDDEGPEIRGRKLSNLKDLRHAVSQISQPRTPSPAGKNGTQAEAGLSPKPLQPLHISFSMGDMIKVGRRVSHVRSATEPNAAVTKSAESSLTVSEEESDEELRKKPQMVRKKSGELVRPALRPPSRRRPSSMPGTPVFSKAVHFDSHLEHVRHFLQVDRPLAVSAGSSPADNYDSDREYPFPSDEERRSGTWSPPYEWEMITPNFPHDGPDVRKTMPVRVEKVWISGDQKSMLGSIAVANIAFHKSVVCRFTLDYWKTTSEVAAEYCHEIRPKDTPLSYDRFNFSIKLSDMANLESKTLFFCIRYTVNGQDYWDNNNSANFQVDFRKKYLQQNGKKGVQGAASRPANGLPRSNRRPSPSTGPRPKSMPVTFDEFGNDTSKFDYDRPVHEYLGESGSEGGLRLKSRSSSNLASDNLTKGLSSPSGVAFANRYDFGASLSAAVQAAKDTTKEKDKDALYMKNHVRGQLTTASSPPQSNSPVSGTVQSTPGTSSPIPGLPSSSYEELVNKYCFFGSKQSSPTMTDGTLKMGRFDGGEELSTGSTNSSAGSPQMVQHAGPAAHHTAHFYGPPHHIGFEPAAGSPLRTFSPAGSGSQSSTPKAGPSYVGASNDYPYGQQLMLSDRFPWSSDAHTATAIRG